MGGEVLEVGDLESGSSFNIKNSDKDLSLSLVLGNDPQIQRLKNLAIRTWFPKVFTYWAANTPKGYILSGPAGCGKTLAARCFASEAKAKIIELRQEDIASPYVDKPVQLLKKFRKTVETLSIRSNVVVFIDEIDSILPNRSGHNMHEHDRKKVNFFLEWIDGGLTKSYPVTFIGTTNAKELIDPAIIRPGRLEVLQFIHISKVEDLLTCLKNHLLLSSKVSPNKKMFSKINFDKIQLELEGLNGSDIHEIVVQLLENKALQHVDNLLQQGYKELHHSYSDDLPVKPAAIGTIEIMSCIREYKSRLPNKQKVGFRE